MSPISSSVTYRKPRTADDWEEVTDTRASSLRDVIGRTANVGDVYISSSIRGNGQVQ